MFSVSSSTCTYYNVNTVNLRAWQGHILPHFLNFKPQAHSCFKEAQVNWIGNMTLKQSSITQKLLMLYKNDNTILFSIQFWFK